MSPTGDSDTLLTLSAAPDIEVASRSDCRRNGNRDDGDSNGGDCRPGPKRRSIRYWRQAAAGICCSSG